jgi:quercetin dioxygenase-like cupin family protein
MARVLSLTELRPKRLSDVANRYTVQGEGLMICRYEVKKGCRFAPHAHPEEQMGFVIEGRIEFYVGDDEKPLLFEAGSFFRFAPNESHGSRVLEDATVLDVFTPVRPEYREEAVSLV